MPKTVREKLESAARMQTQLENASEEDRDTIIAIMIDVVDVVLSEEGAGVMFADKHGTGEMSVHLIGDQTLTPSMLLAAPEVYAQVFGVPAGATAQ